MEQAMEGGENTGLRQLVGEAVRAEFTGMFEELRRFVDRRIAELSTEIHATVEMVDFSETNLTKQLARMHQQLSRVVALPAAATRNSGLELAGVVQATEDAANRIMGAAEKISAALNDVDPKQAVLEQVNAIFEACSFQDLTSQRIRRVLDQLTAVDHMLAQMAEHTQHPEGTAEKPREPIRLTFEMLGTGPDLAQSEIDRLMSG
jgi:chemotaxis protein CheZ